MHRLPFSISNKMPLITVTNVVFYCLVMSCLWFEVLRICSGNQLSRRGLLGKGGATYSTHGGLCLETQRFPDFVNKDNFGDGLLYPGRVDELIFFLYFFTFSWSLWVRF